MARRVIGRAALWLGVIAAAWVVSSMGLPAAVSAQEGDGRAALVVRFGDGTVQSRCVSFAGPSITGLELLARSGLPIDVDTNSGLGGAVCSIDGQGCGFPAQDCFCRCQGIRCEYWAYYHWIGGRWQYAHAGASSYRVMDGALEGWSWGPGNFSSGTEPPQVSFEDVCAADASAAPTGTAVSAPPVDSLLVPAVHAEGLAAADSGSARPVPPTVEYLTRLPGYAAFLLCAAALLGAGAWVRDRRRKAAIAVDAGRESDARGTGHAG